MPFPNSHTDGTTEAKTSSLSTTTTATTELPQQPQQHTTTTTTTTRTATGISSSVSSSSSLSSSSLSLSVLEEKLLSLDDNFHTQKEVVQDVQNANYAELDTILAKEMNRLSFEERDHALHEIHGVADTIPENIEFVNTKLQQLDDCISEMIQQQQQQQQGQSNKNNNNKTTDAYERALYMSPDYVQDIKFRLMFLRGEQFNVERAATRLLRHFEEKQSLFGSNDVLGRDVQLNDFINDDDDDNNKNDDNNRKGLHSGFIQILPHRDRADRAVVCLIPSLFPPDPLPRMRAIFYVVMTILQDEETQRNGIVVVILNVSPHHLSLQDATFMVRGQGVKEGLPYRIAGIHYCFDSMILYPFVTITRYLFGRGARKRFRSHFGSHTEYSYALQTFGIPSQCLPIDRDGNVLLDYHLEWLEGRKVQEGSSLSSDPQQRTRRTARTIIPRRFDILFGRGPVSEHTGNLRAFHIVEMNRERYEQASKFQKTQIASRIVHLIHQSYGRFLKKENGCFYEVDDEVAREKISHFFRRLREVDTQQQQQQQQKFDKTKATKRAGHPPDDESSSPSPSLPPPPPGNSSHETSSLGKRSKLESSPQ